MKIGDLVKALKAFDKTENTLEIKKDGLYKVLNIKDNTVYLGEYENEENISTFTLADNPSSFEVVEAPQEEQADEDAEGDGRVRGRRGRPRNSVSEATNGQLVAGLENSLKNIAKLKELKVLNDDQIKERFRKILDRCLDLMEQHFMTMDIKTVTYIRTPNGPKKVTMGGFAREDYEALMGTVELISEILVGKVQMPEKAKDQKLLIRSYLRPAVEKREEEHEPNSNPESSLSEDHTPSKRGIGST